MHVGHNIIIIYMHLYSTEYKLLLIGMQHHIIIIYINTQLPHSSCMHWELLFDFNRELLIKMPRTSAIHCKVDRSNGNTHITQDVVRAILWVLPGRSCAVSFAIAIMSSEQCLHICNTIVTHPVLMSSDHNHSNYSSSLATIILWRHTVWLCSWQRFCMLVYVA